MINAIVMIPDIVKELASLPEEYKQYKQDLVQLQEMSSKVYIDI